MSETEQGGPEVGEDFEFADLGTGPFVVDIGYAAKGNPGPAAWVAWITSISGQGSLIGETVSTATSPAISAKAILGVLRWLPEGAVGRIRWRDETGVKTVSTYIPEWERNGWKKAGGGRIANIEFWRRVAIEQKKRPEMEIDYVAEYADPDEYVKDEADRRATAEKKRQNRKGRA